MIDSQKHRAFGLFWAAFAILVWSGSLVLLKLGVTTHLNSYDLTALRMGTAGALLLPVILKRRAALRQLGIVGCVMLIICFGAPYIVLISEALKTASASAAGALNPGVMAASAVLLGAVLTKSRASHLHLMGVALILLAAIGQVLWVSAGLSTGHVILVLTGLLWAIYTMIVRTSGVSALDATAVVATGSALVYLPVYLFALPKQIAGAPVADILLQAGFQGVLVSVLAVYAFNRSTELLGPVISSDRKSVV